MSINYFGLYRGIVINNDDPLCKMRIQVEIPDVLGEGSIVWAMPCVPPGVISVPDVGDGVWIAFEAGDLNRPVWMGTFGVM